MNRHSLIAGAVLLSAASVSFADDYQRDRRDAYQAQHEVRQDVNAARGDAQDVWRAQNLLARFDQARSTNDWRTLKEMDRWVRGTLRKEIIESSAELEQAKREVKRDVRSARADRRELERDRYYGDRRDARDDGRDLGRDHHEIRKDIYDAKAKRWELERKQQLAAQMDALEARLDGPSLDQKRGILVQLIELERGELARDHGEIREDQHEVRQNVNEGRHDRRDGRY